LGLNAWTIIHFDFLLCSSDSAPCAATDKSTRCASSRSEAVLEAADVQQCLVLPEVVRLRQLAGHNHISVQASIGTDDTIFVEEVLDFILTTDSGSR
jgi:hypothetical protein